MIEQPKDATSSTFIKLDGIIKDIEIYALSHDNTQLHSLNNAIGLPLYMLTAGTGCRAKPFGIPIKIMFGGKDVYVVDGRQVTAISSIDSFKITNHPELDTIAMTGLMAAIWDSPDRHMVANVATDLSPIYATWLSSTIAASFNLHIDQRTEVSIVAAWFYWNLLNIEDNVDKIIGRISKDLKLDFDRVSGVVDTVGPCATLDEFIVALKGTSGGLRLDKFDIPTLYQVSTGVWSGASGRTIMEIAIEYPPYIVALTNNALTDKSHKRTRFFEYVHLYDRRIEIMRLPEAVSHLKKTW